MLTDSLNACNAKLLQVEEVFVRLGIQIESDMNMLKGLVSELLSGLFCDLNLNLTGRSLIRYLWSEPVWPFVNNV
jgi:hypothetical protein